MQRASTLAELHAALSGRPKIGFVPTMGKLHAGHRALVEHARTHASYVVASVFVNPLQFGPDEDFDRYPRTLDADCAALEAAGCDLVFTPDTALLYPTPQTFLVQPPAALADILCGAHRPGHFAGVATVVLKLFNLVRPDFAVFGRKDYQQLAVIRAMVSQFNLPVAIHDVATVRASDGLALSSRNQYLTAAERPRAAQLHAELTRITDAIERGERDANRLAHDAARRLKMAGWQVDYVSVRDADTLAEATPASRAWIALGAAWLGKTRLIDNREAGLTNADPRA